MLNRYKWYIIKIVCFLLLGNIPIANLLALADNKHNELMEAILIQAIIMDDDEKGSCERNFTIYYPLGNFAIVPEFDHNEATINSLRDFINHCNADESITIKQITLTGSCSVEGPERFNSILATHRYLTYIKYLEKNNIDITKYPVRIISDGANWPLLTQLIDHSNSIYKSELLTILNSELPDSIQMEQIQKIDDGNAFRYLQKNIFPKMRFANIGINYDSIQISPKIEEPIVKEIEITEDPKPFVVYEEVVELIEYEPIWKPLFALKTNLLFDAMTDRKSVV